MLRKYFWWTVVFRDIMTGICCFILYVMRYVEQELIDKKEELDKRGWYIKKSDMEVGKNLRYCAACYENTGRLYPITQGSLKRYFFLYKLSYAL